MPSSSFLITFALPEESRDFRDALKTGQRKPLRIEHIGVGPEIAAQRMTALLAAEKPSLVICTGFAGGLAPGLIVGDLIVADNLSDAHAVACVRELASPPCRFGAVISRAEPVESVVDKTTLFRETGALAVDMENEAVAAACRDAGVPLLVVRVISDPAETPLPVPFDHWFDVARQKPRVLGLLKYLTLHPGRIGAFAGFVRGLAPARRALADFLLSFLARNFTSF